MKATLPTETVNRSRLLLVDDDPEICELLTMYLSDQGFDIFSVGHGGAMDEWLSRNTADLVILDLMLPGEDGLSLARRLHTDHALPIIMISARGEDIDRIVGLEVGADDYLAKPFNPRELLARVRAVLRRNWPDTDTNSDPDAGQQVEFGPFRLDAGRRTLSRDGAEIDLSRAEFDLLMVFVARPNIVLSRDQIMDFLKHCDRDPFDRSVDVRVTRLRHKIEDDPAHPKMIRTVWGVGYQFMPEEAAV
jgi:two-component system, OmpR family, phosphate regulon response regulator OmpR